MVDVNNKLVAKNAMMLTIRMLIVAVVGLFTSRIVLNALGVEDYGVYGLVGGIVGFVSFLNGSMGGATMRFITYEIGTGNQTKLQKIFSTALAIHAIIAVVAIILAETIGLWFLNVKLNIPQNSMFAANIIYQLSVFSIAISFTQVPYSSTIIAHEKMSIYAYFEIINTLLKLGTAYLLLVVPNKLIMYGVFNFCITVFTLIFYRLYCNSHFPEARFSLSVDRSIAKEMASFSAYDLYGNMSVMVYLQGLPIVLNLFLGVVANAASSIGNTVIGVVKGFSWSVSNAFIPQITKQYASGNIDKMEVIMCRSIQFTVLTFSIISIPFIIEPDRVLFLWLKQVPPYTVLFIRIIMVMTIIDYLTMSNNRAVHATGDIKKISLISGSFYLVAPFISYGLMNMGGPAYTPYLVNCILLSIVTIIGVIIVKDQISQFKAYKYARCIVTTFVTAFLSIALTSLVLYPLLNRFPVQETSSWVSIWILAFTLFIGSLITILLSFVIVFGKEDRNFIHETISNYIIKLKRSIQ